MKNYIDLENLPILDLKKELFTLLEKKVIDWDPVTKNQICITTHSNFLDDTSYGCGSFVYDWAKLTVDKNNKWSAPLFENPKKEEDFTELCSQFKGTLFEEVYISLKSSYKIGRIRIMNLNPKTCLTWHYDETCRIHYPIKTQVGAFMVVDNEVKHLESSKWYLVNTVKRHTVFNGSVEDRIHLVASVLGHSIEIN